MLLAQALALPRAKRRNVSPKISAPKQRSSLADLAYFPFPDKRANVVIEHAPLEDELGDILDKAMCHAGITEHALAEKAGVLAEKIHDAIDYRYDLSDQEILCLAKALELNGDGLLAIAHERYPLPEIAGLPFCLFPLRFPHGIGVANAYVVADCCDSEGLLFDTGTDFFQLKRLWPRGIKRLKAVFLTHAETEHIGGLKELLASEGQVPVFGPEGKGLEATVTLGESAKLSFGRIEVQALKTPGHCESHNCYVVTVPEAPSSAPLLITGDTLFAGSIGKAYFCQQKLTSNLRRMMELFSENTVIAPGHGPLTTIKNERRFNPFVV